MDIAPEFKRYKSGTHRAIPPEETLQKIAGLLPAFGITRVANVTGLDRIGIPVVMVTRPNSRSLAVSQGKGYTLECAKVSGLMESIENFHAERLDIPSRFLSYEDLFLKYKVIDVMNTGRSRAHPFRADRKIPWVEGTNLVNGEKLWVPHEMVHSDYTLPDSFDGGYFNRDSNGLSSGNTLIEAIIHGMCEVIERDCLALWYASDEQERIARSINAGSITHYKCRDLLQKYEDSQIAVGLWDITSDVGVPAFICKIIQSDDHSVARVRPAMGSGCHPDKNVALSRALTEAAQSRLTFISGARDDQPQRMYDQYQSDAEFTIWHKEITSLRGERNFDALPQFCGEFLNDDFAWVTQRLISAGIEQIVYVDLMKEEFKIPVVKVIIPGMESPLHSDRIPGWRLRKFLKKQEERNG